MSELPDLGIVVTDFFNLDFLSPDFIVSACQNFSMLDMAWKNPPKWVRNDSSMPILCGQYKGVASENYKLHLFTFPSAIRRDFSLRDLDFPFKIAGIIFLVDLDNDAVTTDELPKHLTWLKSNDEKSGITWAHEAQLPLVVAAIFKKEVPNISKALLSKLLDLQTNVPILPYRVNPENMGFRDLGDAFILYYTYTYEYTQAVVNALIQQK